MGAGYDRCYRKRGEGEDVKVVVINGSPRGAGSNSMKLTQAFLKGMLCEDATVYHLREMNIGHCRGCFACWTI